MASTPSPKPWTQMPDGIALDVRLTPRSVRDAIEGIACLADGRCVLKVRVRAAPVEGEANAALQRLIAKELGIAQRQIAFAAGAAARLKWLHISGDTRELTAMLEAVDARTGQRTAKGAT